jgi:CheY-like chemotaxis protein
VRLATLVAPGAGGVPEPVAPAADALQQPRLRVLVAEDNPMNQRLIERILDRDGHEVTIAANGRACCEAWSGGPFHVVLMDMQMPEMSGLEAAAWIRREEAARGQRVPIVALTANTTPEDRRACLDAGMDEMLPKPISIARLRAVLARCGTPAPPAGTPPADPPPLAPH